MSAVDRLLSGTIRGRGPAIEDQTPCLPFLEQVRHRVLGNAPSGELLHGNDPLAQITQDALALVIERQALADAEAAAGHAAPPEEAVSRASQTQVRSDSGPLGSMAAWPLMISLAMPTASWLLATLQPNAASV